MTHPADTESPKSEFIRKAEELLARRLAATTTQAQRALEIELGAWLAAHRVRSAWKAMQDAEAAVDGVAAVPRDTSTDSVCHTRRRATGSAQSARYSSEFDHKRAQAGDRSED